MKRGEKYFLLSFILTILMWAGLPGLQVMPSASAQNVNTPDTTQSTDTTHLIYPFNDFTGNPYLDQNSSPLFLSNPSNVKQEIIYNPKTNTYEFVNKIGNFTYRSPTTMDFNDFQQYELNKDVSNYWKERNKVAGTS